MTSNADGSTKTRTAVITGASRGIGEYATESGREASMNFESRNPATGELLGVYREHDKAQTDARANHKIKETRFRELSPSKGIRSFCS
jgi:NAD(P)-dependent dehydrogenase (short-subunit alcohol dehydrogenase family)